MQRKGQVLPSGGCQNAFSSVQVLKMETLCSLIFFFSFSEINLKQMIMSMPKFLAVDPVFNFTWRPLLGCFSHFVSDCRVVL